MNETKLLPKWSDSTTKAIQADTLRHCGGRYSTPHDELFGYLNDPAWLAKQKYYYLDHIVATSSDGRECEVRLLSDEELSKKKTRKPRKPALTACPHCGMRLDAKPLKAVA